MTAKARESEPVEPVRTKTAQREPTQEEIAERPALGDPEGALKREAKDGMCVVDPDEVGIGHFADGRAIPGTKVCSAHEMSHFRDGTPRANPDGSRRA
jgi:hypothetical protein